MYLLLSCILSFFLSFFLDAILLKLTPRKLNYNTAEGKLEMLH